MYGLKTQKCSFHSNHFARNFILSFQSAHKKELLSFDRDSLNNITVYKDRPLSSENPNSSKLQFRTFKTSVICRSPEYSKCDCSIYLSKLGQLFISALLKGNLLLQGLAFKVKYDALFMRGQKQKQKEIYSSKAIGITKEIMVLLPFVS